jgi:hypothetical protein
MATGRSNNYNLPFPLAADAVNVHGDIKSLTERLDAVLPQASYVDIPVKNVSSDIIPAGYPVTITGHDGTNVLVAKATASTTTSILGLTRTEILVSATGVVVVAGVINSINTSSYNPGDILYVAQNGGLTSQNDGTQGTAIATVVYPAVSGAIIVGSKSNATWGSLKAGLS